MNRHKELGITLAQKESMLRKAILGISRTELEISKAKEQRGRAQGSRAGAVSEVEGQMALQAARLIKEHGIARVTPDMRHRCPRVPRVCRQGGTEVWPDARLLKTGMAEGFAEKVDVEKERKNQRGLQLNLTASSLIDEAKLSEDVAKVVVKAFRALEKHLDKRLHAEMAKIRSGRQTQQNNQ